MNNLKEQWKECIVFYKQYFHKTTIITSISFFAIAGFIFILLYMNEDVLTSAYAWLMSLFEGKDLDIDNITAFALFKNNSFACLYTIGMGYIPFFYIDLVSLITNAAMIGILLAVYVSNHMSLALFMAGLLPHGIFELPAIFLSLAIGFKTCSMMGNRIIGKMESFDFKLYTLEVLRFFMLVILPLLIMAALIEAYITPICMQWFM